MEWGADTVSRELPIDAALCSALLLRLRRDAPERHLSWTLGDRGAAEVDVHFHPTGGQSGAYGPAWSTTARLWDAPRLALTTAVVEMRVCADDRCEVSLRLADPVPASWQGRTDELAALARAAVDELAEELLWHASRPDFSRTQR